MGEEKKVLQELDLNRNMCLNNPANLCGSNMDNKTIIIIRNVF